ncbi:GAF domain-containing protein [Luteolibacter flavescens]|uniref:GAF domain-containing protein n=1 Tax=Luteolibacter flavescens TaxID=1859460 RepID=A0ABT3FSV4_9BACT|nr:GAF domain-containing protein [Luteolibacter flavescens]MCW1886661.1 GAF domain-containing protein [Luteolibacter flavescens]
MASGPNPTESPLSALVSSSRSIAADLEDTRLLHELGARLVDESNIGAIYQEILSAAITLAKADAGSVQVVEPDGEGLSVLVSKGFSETLIARFHHVDISSPTSCGLALKTKQRAYVNYDRSSGEEADPSLQPLLDAGFHSAQSTPLVNRRGRPIGMITTHWRKSHRPSDHELRFLDLLARQAADLIERRTSEEALRESERRYRTLFDSIDEGFCTIEVIFDEHGYPGDYRFLQVNPSFIRLTGITDAVGRTMREISTDHEPHWFEAYGRIARSGKPERFIAEAKLMHRWYDVFAFRIDEPGDNHVAILFSNVTRRIETDEKLRQSAAMDAYRVLLSDTLRQLVDPGEIQGAAARILGEQIQASRAVYVEVRSGEDGDHHVVLQHYHAPDASKLTGSYRANDFGGTLFDELRAGKTLVVDDVARDTRLTADERSAYPNIDIGAYVAVPLLKEGKHVAIMAAHHKIPRHWHPDEIALVEETAERTWDAVERARAEQARHQSEQWLRIALDSAQMASWDWEVGTDSVKWNDQHFRLFGLVPDGRDKSLEEFSTYVYPADRERVVEELTSAVAEARAFQSEFRIIREDNGEVRWMCSFGQTVECDGGRALRLTGVIYDDTRSREHAEQLRQAHDALESRVKERTRELAGALRRLQDEADERKKIERERRDLLQRIVHLQEAERARVARELHDNLGQHMVAVLMHLEGFQRRLMQSGNEAASHDLDEFRKVVDALIKATHRQSWELRPAELDELGLEVAVENYVLQWSEQTRIAASFTTSGKAMRTLEPEEMIALYRVTQEALTNVARHSSATEVQVTLETEPTVCIHITDNGVGFHPQYVKRRLGLLGMQERMNAIGGALVIDSSSKRGTHIQARLP